MHRFLIKFILLLVIEVFLANGCIEHERQALLQFKACVNDPSNRLGSWRGDECCNWAGIGCSNRTGLVVRLNLQNPYSYLIDDYYSYSNWIDENDLVMKHSLSGKVSPSLLALSKLKYLDLSYNNFTKIAEFIGSLKKLRYLNLSNGYFSGNIPDQLGNLSQLQFLDLSNNDLLASANIQWISRLTSLRHLDMSGVTLQNYTEWVQPLNQLPLLEVLVFESNSLTYIPRLIPLLNFTSLRKLQLSHQNFSTTIPSWIFQLQSLTDLNLIGSNFFGQLPNALGNLTSLSKLVVDFNPLYGKIPPLYNLTKLSCISMGQTSLGEGNITQIFSSLTHETRMRLEELSLWETNLTGNLNILVSEMSNLKYLNLGFNNITGPIPKGIKNLKNLIVLGLGGNYLTGPIPEDIGNLKNLVELDLYNNCLTGPIPEDIGNLKNIVVLFLSLNSFTGSLTEVHLGRLSKLEALALDYSPITITVATNWKPSFQLRDLGLEFCRLLKFPTWLQNQLEIEWLDLSSTEIDDVLPDWLWSLVSLTDLNLHDNTLRGQLPNSLENMKQLNSLVLSNNHLEGKIPLSYPESLYGLYLYNNRFEQFSGTLEAPNLIELSLANNRISGSIESTFCRVTKLSTLDLSSNNLSGNLPNCSLNDLLLLNLGNNKLAKTIPDTLCYSGSLSVLQLNNNIYTGEFPSSLSSCEKLTLLDIGDNKFHGELPKWVGENFSSLEILRLRSNFFSGSIPSELTMLKNLHFLDLSENYFSGCIPRYLDNLTAMITLSPSMTHYYGYLPATIKGSDRMYCHGSLEYLASIDLSNNNLTGVIPDKLVALTGLVNLNLSNNHLIGKIPIEVGKLKSLESLDLHMNNLSGSIPQSMSTLYSLAVLNLSYNNLSGPIPRGYQLQTLDNPSTYMENPYLCGPPLKVSCDSSSSPGSSNNEGHFGDKEKLWFYLFVEFGFVVGFLGLFMFLLFKRTWRYAFFYMVDRVFDRIYVLGALTLKRLREQT